MARDIEARLRQLNNRRKGLDRIGGLTTNAASEVASLSAIQEGWETRSRKPNTRYALGAMQEVGTKYTAVSLETAERVGNQLKRSLLNDGFNVDFRLQGSVPLNVHIRGVSDVDLLTLDLDYLTYDTFGYRARANGYTPSSARAVDVILRLRTASERVLERVFPAATVNKEGGKAITISGGSLARSVDVVPSIWHDNSTYQMTQAEHDRTVVIANKAIPETIHNLPFLHIKNVHEVDRTVIGGLKKSIRLCKHVKNDAKEEKKVINLPSFDIAALMYHADKTALSAGIHSELAILAETQRFLDFLHVNKEYAKTLRTPDNSRAVIDTPEKLTALTMLSVEIDDLSREVAKEQTNFFGDSSNILLENARRSLSTTYQIQ